MNENIYNLDLSNCDEIKDIMLKQLHDMNERIIKLDVSKWYTIKPRYKKELTDYILTHMRNIKLFETDNLYIRASIKSSDISEKLKSEFLNNQLNNKKDTNYNITNFDLIVDNVLK